MVFYFLTALLTVFQVVTAPASVESPMQSTTRPVELLRNIRANVYVPCPAKMLHYYQAQIKFKITYKAKSRIHVQKVYYGLMTNLFRVLIGVTSGGAR